MRFRLSSVRWLAPWLCASAFAAQPDYSRPFSWQTLSGRAPFGYADGSGAAAQFAHPGGIAVAASGTIYVADTTNCVIRAISPAGGVTTIAGQAGVNGYRDGAGTGALLQYPAGIVAAPDGNLYITDGSQTIRRVTPAGVVTTVVGTAWVIGSADGHGAAASFWNPAAISVDPAGNLYVGDGSNLTVRKITPSFDVTTLAGTAGQWGSTDATGPAARLGTIAGLAADAAGNVYVADGSNQTIRMITPAGVVTTLAGMTATAGTADGTGSAARFHNPGGLAIDGAGNLVILDSGSDTVRVMTPAGAVTTFVGTPNAYGSADGTGPAAQFDGPSAVAVDGNGNLYVVDGGNSTIRRITPSAVVTTLAGSAAAVASETDGGATAARFTFPWGVARDGAGSVYVTDVFAHTVRKVTPAGMASTVAGLANTAGSADGVGAAARFNQPAGIAVDPSGTAYVADAGNNTIRKIASNGTVTTFAGTAGVAGSQDGMGVAATFNNPQGLALDPTGNVYVADTGNHVIRKITPGGAVQTFAGTAGAAGSTDGALASAKFNSPMGVCVGANYVVYVADTSNGTIRKISLGTVSTFAGAAGNWGFADGLGAAAAFYGPEGVAVDGNGIVYVADTFDNMVRRITPEGYVTTIGGVEEVNNAIDGRGGAAQFNLPSGIFSDSSGNLIVADAGNNLIRIGVPSFTAVGIASAPHDQSVLAGSAAEFSVSGSGTGTLGYQWARNGLAISGATNATFSLAHAEVSDAGTYTVTVTDSIGETASASASLTVLTLPTILTPPAPQTVTAGQTASFSVNASGAAGYQWKFNGDAIAGVTQTTLSISNTQPANAGNYTVTLTNTGGAVTSDPALLTVIVPPPDILAGPSSQSVAVGGSAQFTVSATGAKTYQWAFNGAAIADGTSANYMIANAAVTDAGAYSVTVANEGGGATSAAAFLTVAAPSGGPMVAEQPSSFTASPGATVILTVGATGAVSSAARAQPFAQSLLAYQWYRDGAPLGNGNGVSGAKSATLVLSGPAVQTGAYLCLITGASGSAFSHPATLTVVASSNPGRLINVSSRAAVGSSSDALISGFVVGGSGTSGTAPILVRASGPALRALGVSGTLADPSLQLFHLLASPVSIAVNDGWAGNALVASTAALVSAFPWNVVSSHDSAVVETVAAGSYTANVQSSSGATGIALLEIYDARTSADFSATSPRLVNISARARVGTGANALIAGFVIGGDTARTVLIRASGPALGAFGLTGILADPKLELFHSGATAAFATNAGWGGDANIAAAAAKVNAFGWAATSSADSALLITLPPGAYTANVSGATGDAGIALLEVYEVE